MEEYIQVFTTTNRKELAEAITRALVEQRLAACVQTLGPISSTYWWRGNIETTEEWLCIIKSSRTLYHRVEETIKSLHHYEVPEIIAVPITEGSDGYIEWLRNELKRQQ